MSDIHAQFNYAKTFADLLKRDTTLQKKPWLRVDSFSLPLAIESVSTCLKPVFQVIYRSSGLKSVSHLVVPTFVSIQDLSAAGK